MYSIAELRRQQYEYHYKKFPYLKEWARNPYTILKARFYMEASAVLVHFLLKTKIKPNTVTIAYGLAGVVGAVLLSIPFSFAHILAVVIFFTKGILDWSDGHLARVTGQTSLRGHVLDVYGALLNHLAFQVGLGFYVLYQTGNAVFYAMIPLIPFFYAVSLKSFSQKFLFEEITDRDLLLKHKAVGPERETIAKENVGSKGASGFQKWSRIGLSLLDARARTVDFICLLIVVEMVTNVSLTWIIFMGFFLKAFAVFLGGYYFVMRKGFIEEAINDVRNSINRLFKESYERD